MLFYIDIYIKSLTIKKYLIRPISQNITRWQTRIPFMVWKIGFVLLFLVVMGWQVQREEHLASIWSDFVRVDFTSQWYFGAIALILVSANWWIESQKWKLLLSQKVIISSKTAFKSICFGVSSGLITPHRIGEYGGRLLFLPSTHHGFALLSTFISSLSQNLINICLGSICALLFYKIYFGLSTLLFISGTGLLGVILMAILFLYFNIRYVNQFLPMQSKRIWIQKTLNQLKSLEHFSKNTLYTALYFSCLRYFIYVFQYVLLLYFFGMNESLPHLLLGVSTIFLIQSSIPLPPLFSVIARGEIALLIWSTLSVNQITILTASYGLWLINLFIPASLGIFFLIQKRKSK